MTNGSRTKCQAKKEELIFKANRFETSLYWGTVTESIINKGIREIKLIVYVSEKGTLEVDK